MGEEFGAFLDGGAAPRHHDAMEKGSQPTSPMRVYLGILGYMLQILGLLLMPVALGLGFAIRSNQGLWWMLYAALLGIGVFYGGRALLKWAEAEATSAKDR